LEGGFYMNNSTGIPKGASVAISDLLDNCAKIQQGQEVLLVAHTDGLYGSDNLVDEAAISWIQSAVQARGAHASVLWIDEPGKAHAWRFPPILKAAMSACDVLINHSFNITTEEIMEFRQYIRERKIPMVRNFATTAALLCTAWAQTPHELVGEIRYQSSLPMKAGSKWQLTDDNGTHLEGIIVPLDDPFFPTYSMRREEAGYYRPWPEWVHPPIKVSHTNGIFIFNSMLSWWSRYIGISPSFENPIRLTVDNCRITDIAGGEEATALRKFLNTMESRLGDGVYDFNALHFGVHPQTDIGPHQCPNILYRRLIEHSHTSNIHVHIGAPPATQKYLYWMHCTGDIRTATFRVGDTTIHDRGHLAVLSHPSVIAVSEKYPGRPGLNAEPKSF
jgi:hypothetical protein